MQDITAANCTTLARYLVRGVSPPSDPSSLNGVDRVVPCAALHPAADTCIGNSPAQFWRVFRWMFPQYVVAHCGSLATRPRVLLRNPVWETLRALLGAVRTSTMQGTYVLIYIGMCCTGYAILTDELTSGIAHV